jgi:hypothetical protein
MSIPVQIEGGSGIKAADVDMGSRCPAALHASGEVFSEHNESYWCDKAARLHRRQAIPWLGLGRDTPRGAFSFHIDHQRRGSGAGEQLNRQHRNQSSYLYKLTVALHAPKALSYHPQLGA